MTAFAPILLFVYNRPAHARQAIASLLRNELAAQSPLFVYADAARTDADREAVEETRAFVRQITGFASVTLVEREENWGLARNIIDGVTTQVARYGRVIVLEDDLVVAPYFLQFMNEALETYKDEPRVGHIQACDFTGDPSLPDTFLIKWTGSWGWATWERAWRHFNPDGAALLRELECRGLTRAFDFDGNYPFTRMLRRQVRGENNSWAIRWNASLGGRWFRTMVSTVAAHTAVATVSISLRCGCNLFRWSVFFLPKRTVRHAPLLHATITVPTASGRRRYGD